MAEKKELSRLQRRNRGNILAAALDEFSKHGFRGATLDHIAAAAGMSKPNLIYYYPTKEVVFLSLLDQIMDRWLAPLREIDPNGEPIEEILTYVRRKVRMSRDMPRESRLFAHEIVQGAPRMEGNISEDLAALFGQTKDLFEQWMRQGRLATCDPTHLIFSIWATTQHYADFDAQIQFLADPNADVLEDAETFLITLYRKMLTPD
ncbi:MAG: TetR family transcriptional regulator C-terminal domain-containing protein [Pseudomonadota bacterium]